MTGVVAIAFAALWGFAEATVFFVVPDVWLTIVTVRFGPRLAFVAAIAAALSAAAGGLVMLRLSAAFPEAVAQLLDMTPAISPAMIAETTAAMHAPDWPFALLQGSVTGRPYKLYAAGAGPAGIDPLVLAAVTVPARFARFSIAILVAAALRALLPARLAPGRLVLVTLAAWAAFYALFWGLMPR
ncbi:MAG: hypothetical protein R3D33_02435 [Hyphomicrobiaceae bacterium]